MTTQLLLPAPRPRVPATHLVLPLSIDSNKTTGLPRFALLRVSSILVSQLAAATQVLESCPRELCLSEVRFRCPAPLLLDSLAVLPGDQVFLGPDGQRQRSWSSGDAVLDVTHEPTQPHDCVAAGGATQLTDTMLTADLTAFGFILQTRSDILFSTPLIDIASVPGLSEAVQAARRAVPLMPGTPR